MSHNSITLVLIPTALFLLLASATCSHARGAYLYDISNRGYDVTVYEAAVFGGTRRVSKNSANNWCNITFGFASLWKPKNSSEWVYPTRFTLRIDHVITPYYSVKFELTQYGQRCSLNSSKLLSYQDLQAAQVTTWNFTTGKYCEQKLSIYQDNSYNSASYKIQAVVTPHIDCNISSSSSSSSIYPYKCQKSGECISYPLQCDGFKNCIDGYDENSWCKPPSWWMTTKPSTTPPAAFKVNFDAIFWIIGTIAFICLAVLMAICCGNGKRSMSRTRTLSPVTSPTSTQRSVAGTAPIYHSSASASITVDQTAPPAYENLAMDTVENRRPFEELPPSYEEYSKQLI